MKNIYLLLVAAISLAFRVDAQNPQWLNYANCDQIKTMAEEGNTMWIGTNGNLVKINKTTGEHTSYNAANSGLPGNTINSVVIDNFGNKWIGVWGGGLVKFDNTNWIIYNSSNSGLPDDDILPIVIDENGDKWIGTREGLVLS